MASIIDEIKQARQNLLTDEQKQGLLAFVKHELTQKSFAQIDGARHYCDQVWKKDSRGYYRAPFDKHAAIDDYLRSLGFYTCRYINGFGVDNGMKVYI